MKLKDKVAIVTGSSKGIGEGIAKVFSQEGAKVVVVSRHADEGIKMAKELGSDEGRAIFVETDVMKSESIQNLIKTTVDTFGKLDILVNNAGFNLSKNVEITTEEEWNFVISTNLTSTFLASKYAIPHLRKTHGNIINISSMVGKVGQQNSGAYAATKAGQIAMSKSMAMDFAKDGIRVNVICPGWIQTPLVDFWFEQQKDPKWWRDYVDSKHPLGRIGTIFDCGHAALYLASEDASFITGITIDVDGGVTLGY